MRGGRDAPPQHPPEVPGPRPAGRGRRQPSGSSWPAVGGQREPSGNRWPAARDARRPSGNWWPDPGGTRRAGAASRPPSGNPWRAATIRKLLAQHPRVRLRVPETCSSTSAGGPAGSRTALTRGLTGVARAAVDRLQVRLVVVIPGADVVHVVGSWEPANVADTAVAAEDPGSAGVPVLRESVASRRAGPWGLAGGHPETPRRLEPAGRTRAAGCSCGHCSPRTPL